MEFTDQEITLALTRYARKDAPRQVAAHVCGALAYHRSVQVADYWDITHVLTGRGVVNIVPTEAEAQAIIGLAFESGIDWNQTDPEFVKHMEDQTAPRLFISKVNRILGR